jgi:hypothetical protein
MATESTAIVNLLDLVKNQKPLEKDSSDDMLFGGRVRFDPMAMPAPAHPVMLAVPLPQPFVRQPAAAIEQKTHRVMRVPDGISPKKLALPVGLFVVAMVLLSIYLAKGHSKPEAKATTIVHAPPAAHVEAITPPPAPAPEATPPPAPAPEAVAAAAAPTEQKMQPTVTEIPQPTVTEIQPTVPAVAETVPTVPTVTEAAVAEQPPADDAQPAAKSKRKHHHEHRAAKRTKKETRVATAETPKPAKLEKLGGKGALQISSSPARELWVDGKSTKKSTPQKVTLAPGTHNITLFDKKTRSAKTFQVEIEANKTLRVSKSY